MAGSSRRGNPPGEPAGDEANATQQTDRVFASRRISQLVDLARLALAGPIVSLTIVSPEGTRQWIGDSDRALNDTRRRRLVAAVEAAELPTEAPDDDLIATRVSSDVIHLGEEHSELRWIAARVSDYGVLIACDEEPWQPGDATAAIIVGFAGAIEQVLERRLNDQTTAELRVEASDQGNPAPVLASRSSVAVIGLDPEGRATFANDAASDLFGVTADALIDQPIIERYLEMDAPGLSAETLVRFFRSGQPINGWNAMVRRSVSDAVPVEMTFVPSHSDAGVVSGGVLRLTDMRERRAVLLTAQHSAARHQAFLEMTLDSIITLDSRGTVVEFNRAAERTFGFDEDEVLGKSLLELLVSDADRSWFEEAFKTFARSGTGRLQEQRVSLTCRRSDGSTFPAEVTVTRLPAEHHHWIFTLYVHDLTERTWNERRRLTRYAVTRILAEIDSPEESMPELLRAISEGLVWDWAACWSREPGSTEMRIELTWHREGVNAGAMEIARRQATFTPGYGFLGDVWIRRHSGWIADISASEFYVHRESALSCGFRSAAAIPILGREEVIGLMEFHSQTQRNPDNEILRLFDSLGSQIGQYIERRRVEEERVQILAREQAARTEAQAAERRLAFLAEASAQLSSSLDYEVTLASLARLAVPKLADYCAIDMLREDGRIESLEIADIDPQKEAIGRELQAQYPVDPESNNPVAQVLRTGRPILYEEVDDEILRLFDPGDTDYLNTLRDLGNDSAMYVPLIARGRTLGVISFVSSESGHQYGPSDLALAQELARRAAMAIDNARLYSEAQVAVRVREEFLSIASHELKTPLTTVKGYSQILSRLLRRPEVDRERVWHLVDQLQDQLGRFEILIADLLDISRIQQGRLVLRPETIDLVELSRSVIQRFDHPAEPDPLHHIVLDAPERFTGYWDPDRLDQVLTNLVSNAVKYSPGGGTITVRVEPLECDNEVQLSVTDPGIGIPRSEQDKLFRPFARSETVQRAISGVGLGLYITSQIVERHGGRIELHSSPGTGSTFTVVLPRNSSDETAEADSA